MPKRVLVCDDDPSTLEVVSYLVRAEGYDILTAEDGEEALRLARAELPDAMILDISMPRKKGDAVCRELKSDPATRGVYIIMLTAKCQQDDMQESYRCGADEYMKKPFGPSGLCKRLHQLLD